MHIFDQAVALRAQEPGVFTGQIPTQTYGNMIGPFGGMIAANILQSIMLHPERLGNPVAVTVNYAGPIADAEFTIHAKPARTNRSSQHWLVTLEQNNEVVITATAVTALRSASWSAAERQMPVVPAADSLSSQTSPGFPNWVSSYDFRFSSGDFVMTGEAKQDSESVLWVRDQPPRPLDFLSLMAISDVFFPRVFLRRQQFMPASTISITTYFHATPECLAKQGDAHLLAAARAQRFNSGYFDQSAELWSSDGELLATSVQVVYYKG